MPLSRGFGDRQRMEGIEGRRASGSGGAAPENRHDRQVGGGGKRLPDNQMATRAEDAEGGLSHWRIDRRDIGVRHAPGKLRGDARDGGIARR